MKASNFDMGLRIIILAMILVVHGLNGRAHTADPAPLDLKTAKHFVVVFLSPECPLCQGYTVTLNKLQDQYGKDVPVIGVFPGKAYDDSVYLAFEKKYAIRFVLLKDPDFLMVKKLHARSTPEAFLLDNKGLVLYNGGIDNRAIALGKWGPGPGKAYLALAIEDVLNNRPVAIPLTKAVGCMINDY
jgi:thiol-disulfide isomerase/thioredoxin